MIACLMLGTELFQPTGRYVERSVTKTVTRTVSKAPVDKYIVMFTSPTCGPCQNWKRNEKPKLQAMGVRVVEVDMSLAKNAKYQVWSWPTFWAAEEGTGIWYGKKIVGSVTAEYLEGKVRTRTVVKQTPRKTVERTVTRTARPARYIQWPGWGTIDLETYNRNCNCPMCQGIRSRQIEYRRQMQQWQSQTTPDQEGTPYESIGPMLDAMSLGRDDILADLGCGDARILIEAAHRGVRGIGVEIDPDVSDRARRNVNASGVGHLITIETGDARDFDATRATAITAYLYPELLDELAPKMRSVRVAASPFHEVDGFTQVGDVWIHRRSDAVASAK